MNIIQNQADDFYKKEFIINRFNNNNYQTFIDDVKSNLWKYKKTVHQITFIEWIIVKIKKEYDLHLLDCSNPSSCNKNKTFGNLLFFLQEELEELESELSPIDFSRQEIESLNQTLMTIVNDLNKIKKGQEITYDDLKIEFEELKDLYFLNKKNWVQLFTGKLSEMVAGGVISETISKELAEIIKKSYIGLISSNL